MYFIDLLIVPRRHVARDITIDNRREETRKKIKFVNYIKYIRLSLMQSQIDLGILSKFVMHRTQVWCRRLHYFFRFHSMKSEKIYHYINIQNRMQ